MKLLVVDDVESSLTAVRKGLEKTGYLVDATISSKEALDLIKRNQYQILITDLKMSEYDGEHLLEFIKKESPQTDVIIMTGYSSVESAVNLMQKGAYSYLKKPINIKELRLIIERVIKTQNLHLSVEQLNEKLELHYGFGSLVTNSNKMKDLLRQVDLASKSKSTILIEGESGTGKEVITRLLHLNSPRKEKTFLPLNCSAIPESLFESQLFGHVKGSFTGAINEQKGYFEQADQGTLFLDEISELPLAMQSKLLRVLETREFQKIGGQKILKSDVRVIAATNKNLLELTEAGKFREDLYYRLSIIKLEIPPLRERLDDIPYLTKHFIDQFALENGMPIITISVDAMETMMDYHWPGNVRELKNLIERLFVTQSKRNIKKETLERYLYSKSSKTDMSIPIGDSMSEIEKKAIKNTLRFTKGNRTHAAKILKISLRTLQRKIKEYSIIE